MLQSPVPALLPPSGGNRGGDWGLEGPVPGYISNAIAKEYHMRHHMQWQSNKQREYLRKAKRIIRL